MHCLVAQRAEWSGVLPEERVEHWSPLEWAPSEVGLLGLKVELQRVRGLAESLAASSVTHLETLCAPVAQALAVAVVPKVLNASRKFRRLVITV